MQIKESFDTARKALINLQVATQNVEDNRRYLANMITEICKSLNPDWLDTEKLERMLLNQEIPNISSINGDLRIDGRLNEKNSFITFLKEIM